MLTSPICGICTEHPRSHIFKKPAGMPYWLLMRFHTPFFYESEGTRREGKAGQLLINPPETPLIHGSAESTTEGFCNDWIYFDGEEMNKLSEELDLPLNTAFSLSNTDFFGATLGAIYNEMKQCEAGYTHKISALIASLLVDIGRACRAEGISTDNKTYVSSRSIKNAHKALIENCGYQWTLAEMAELSGYSVSRFCALYKQKYGLTPTEQLIKCRISRAKQILGSGEHNVTEVSELCGFSSLHYFSVTFKKHVGCSPSAYAEKKKNAVGGEEKL